MLKKYKATLKVPNLRTKYTPGKSKKLSDGTIVTNNDAGFKYDIKLVNGQVYTFDISNERNKFMVDSLVNSGKLVEIGVVEEIEEKSNINDDKKIQEESTINTKEIPVEKELNNKPHEKKDKKEKKEPKKDKLNREKKDDKNLPKDKKE